jgi:hypothetical protein
MNGTAGIIKSMGSILPVKYVRYPTACFCRDDKVPGFFDCFLVGGVSHLAFGTGLRPTTHLGMVVAVAVLSHVVCHQSCTRRCDICSSAKLRGKKYRSLL